MIDIQELKAKAEAATKGPWRFLDVRAVGGMAIVPPTGPAVIGSAWDIIVDDCAFIAAANPQAILELIARLEKCQATLGFAASAIKSGERWTPTCEQMFNEALKDTP